MNEIISRVEKHIWTDFSTQNNIGLLTGLSGIALFYDALFNTYNKIEHQEKLIMVIEKINSLIGEEEFLSSLCSGLAGFGWMLQKINNENVEIDEEYFNQFDSILFEELQEQANNNEYDFLHGSIGIVIYFIERYKIRKDEFIASTIKDYTEKLISKIDTNLEDVLLSTSNIKNEKSIYFGLAHGVASVINFLILLVTNCKELNLDITPSLHKCISFLQNNKKYNIISKQFYPNIYFYDTKEFFHSRLSWCQGDLGISNALFNAGVFLGDQKLKSEAILLINNTTKIKLEDSRVNDFAVCHGTSGILIQYHLASQKFNLDFTEEMQYWDSILESQTKNFNEFLGFNGSTYESQTSLLNGSAGLGLVLLTLEQKINTEWLECFNLH